MCSATKVDHECSDAKVELLLRQATSEGGEASDGGRSLPRIVGVQVYERTDTIHVEVIGTDRVYGSRGGPAVEDNSSGTCGGTCETWTFEMVEK